MRKLSPSIHLRLACGLLAGCALVAGQTKRDAATWNASLSPISTPAVLYADAYTDVTGDACAKIHAALAALPATGGTVDARGFQGQQECQTNPFSGLGSKTTKLLLGGTTYVVSVPWVLPNRTRIEGIGSGNQGITSTLFLASNGTQFSGQPSFGSNQPVIQFGSGGTIFGVGVQGIAIDCSGVDGSIGIQNLYAEEQSTVDRVKILGCVDTGLEIRTAKAQNSGPYREIYVTPGSSSLSTTTCARIGIPAPGATPATGDDVWGWRGIIGMTCDARNAVTPMNVGIDIAGHGGLLSGIHIERVTTGIRIANSTVLPTNGLVVENVNGCGISSCGIPVQLATLIQIANTTEANGVEVAMSGILVTGATSVEDDIQGIAVSDKSVARYDLGIPDSNGTRTFLTTATTLTTGAVALISQGSGTPSGSCAAGSIYLNRSSQGATLWVCQPTGWTSK